MSGAVREWWDYAACVGSWDLFYGPAGEYRFDHEKREAEAKAICADCPVQRPCAEAGAGQRFGVWAGTGEAERLEARRARRRALAAAVRPVDGTKWCPHCEDDRPVGEFGKASGRPDGLTPLCREHMNAYARGRKAARAALITDSEMTLMETLDWRHRAACRTVSPDLFFIPGDGERPAARAMRERSARRVCASCPVTGLDGPCAQWAIQTGDRHSISGGMTPEERTAARLGAGPMRAAARRRAEIEAAGEKPCTGPCGQTKPLREFGPSKEGWRGDCKDCRNAYLRRQRRERMVAS